LWGFLPLMAADPLSPFSTGIIPSPSPPAREFDYNPWNL
jgi:hypothetical protein